MSCKQASATVTETTRKSSRVRLAAIVYAVVVIMGITGTGAHALWSQNGTAVTSVTTGVWAPQLMSGASVKCSPDFNWPKSEGILNVAFTPPVDADLVEVTIIDVAQTVHTEKVKVNKGGQATAKLPVTSEWLKTTSFSLSLTPSYLGIATEPVQKTVTVDMRFLGNIKASCG
ncbi:MULTISPECIES: hypothetical protein [Micrococcaceae]|uniref:hypothetical protein n=1 Tax=Micrococcaceae TaxID=1268 RepID=UPI000BB6E515|nr:hypothetical protein [Glutamicibacter sp. BW78]PCC25845.1 hypothetical protein CIK75_05050 [Glutamicibacter sp. BW78]